MLHEKTFGTRCKKVIHFHYHLQMSVLSTHVALIKRKHYNNQIKTANTQVYNCRVRMSPYCKEWKYFATVKVYF